MSDRLDFISKEYDKNVLSEESRSVGLFTIPEYPELEARGMWSTVLDTLLTTLRYLAPATLLTLFWTHHTFFFDILKYIDSAFRTVIFSSEDKKQEVIQWLSEVGPVRVEELETVWRHGWIVCGVLDAVLPGACAGHPPTRLSLKHAQSIADHYLGVEPMFTRQELEANDALSKHEEWKLIKYLDKVRVAITKLSPPPAVKAKPEPTPVSNSSQFTLDYIARGSGLTAAQVNNKMFIKIYPTAQQSLDPGELTILIRGPKNIYGQCTLSPILGKAQMIRETLLGLQAKPNNYTASALPVTQGTTYLRNYGKNDMNKTYYIPKTKYDIDIDVERKTDHAKIGYIVPVEGKYEITITSRGENIAGSPFVVTASKNIVGILEKESFSLEDGEEIDIVDKKITDDEVRKLMELDGIESNTNDTVEYEPITEDKIVPILNSNKFHSVATRVLKMNRVCKALHAVEKSNKQEKCPMSNAEKHQNGIPDIVNSTFEKNNTSQSFYEREKIIIPESISVSLLMDKCYMTNSNQKVTTEQKEQTDMTDGERQIYNIHNLDTSKILQDPFEDDNLSIDTSQSNNNPFFNDVFDLDFAEKELRSFIPSEYETHNSQNEECHTLTNPFINFDDDEPKSEFQLDKSLENEVMIDALLKLDEYSEARTVVNEIENINPFFTIESSATLSENSPVTDFIIGAPVSLPSLLGHSISETNLEASIHKSEEVFHDKYNFRKENDSVSFLSSQESLEQREDPPAISPFHSLGSDTYNFLGQSNLQRSRNISPKDLWDSAYVSIDDSASSSDNNYNHSDRCVSEAFIKSSFSTNNDLSDDVHNIHDSNSNESVGDNFVHEDLRGLKWEFKRQAFTPIIEENEKSIPYATGESTSQNETDTVSQVFADLNEIYDDIFPKPDESIASVTDESTLQNVEEEYVIENNEIRVDSASETLSDVKRIAGEVEGTISEIQASDTESVSASQNLEAEYILEKNITKTQFGDSVYSNIVLEKKKYWDEKIRQIEAKSIEESKLQQKRKRISAKHRHNDSLSKRKGKQIVKNFLNSSSSSKQPQKNVAEEIVTETRESENVPGNVKLVEKWKTFWDSRLEEELNDKDKIVNSCPQLLNVMNSNQNILDSDEAIITTDKLENTPPIKHELPEEVFKAFETCPKRFFGTSRKHILSKIDSFLGKPKVVNTYKPESDNMSHESGLVSSRITLFHTISNNEELPWRRRKQIPKLFNTSAFVNINNGKETSHDVDTYNFSQDISDVSQSDKTSNDDVCNNYENVPQKIKFSLDNDDFNIKEKKLVSNIENNLNDTDSTYNDVNNTTLLTKPPHENDYIDQNHDIHNESNKSMKCRKLKSFSKSEMDIFSKIACNDIIDDFDKHKSVEDLPKINVKSFITLYEDVTKLTQSTLTKTDCKLFASRKKLYNSSSSPGTPSKSCQNPPASKHFLATCYPKLNQKNETTSTKDIISCDSDIETRCASELSERESSPERDRKYLSLSDIELEIIEKNSDNETLEKKADETANIDYKSRFKMAKQYFQSLEELRVIKKDRKLSECKIILNNESIESLENLEQEQKTVKRTRRPKSKSMPSSEIAKIWNQMQEKVDDKDKKLVKISEKFHVEDLFEDVMEGRLSRQGSLRGIPHKKAVLEAFKSMENLTDSKFNSYDMVSQTSEISQEKQNKNAQNYLSEYPYLPTTDPSNFQPRFDANASGLISYNELLNSRPRRNSVPDIRLNPTFTENL
ncbi:unnamed protein product [Leptosia nina]|uniref:Uncharacterized protein n=1 Tax=Leptosia nina TaxID=320188 RepID=A0AAV1J7G7_9NEOP